MFTKLLVIKIVANSLLGFSKSDNTCFERISSFSASFSLSFGVSEKKAVSDEDMYADKNKHKTARLKANHGVMPYAVSLIIEKTTKIINFYISDYKNNHFS